MPPGHPFALVDAFVTDRPFSGNPAGVMVLDGYPDDAWLQGVADELHQAETAFLVRRGDSAYRLRWFTPVTEVGLCGHATLASAHWLWESGALPIDAAAEFETRGGHLTARRVGDLVELDFPAVPATETEMTSELASALAGPTPVWVGRTAHEDPADRNIIAVLDAADAVRGLAPNLESVARLPAGGLIVTARDPAAGAAAAVSRYFAPAVGIPEDSVTGSAHCTIGPFWRAELGDTLAAEQASTRGGRITVVTTDEGRVRLAGRARTSVTGVFHAG